MVTSPPYGPSTHGQVAVAPGEGVQKYHHLYGNTLDRGNLANIGHHRLLAGFTRILAALRTFLKPGGHIAITIRPWREHAELIDLPAQILACGRAAGLIPVERNVALLARAAETDLVARGIVLPARLHPQTARSRAAAAPDRARGRPRVPHRPAQVRRSRNRGRYVRRRTWSTSRQYRSTRPRAPRATVRRRRGQAA